MQVTVTGRNIEVTPALRDYLSDKLQRAQKHFDQDLECKALLSVSKNPSVARCQTAEITINLHGQIIRGEESTENMYASIDLVADKVERQLRKYKARYLGKVHKAAKDKRHKDKKAQPHEVDEDEIVIDEDEIAVAVMERELQASKNKNGKESKDPAKEEHVSAIVPKIVRSKRFPLKPMSAEEACQAMELLGHDFFMFLDHETKKISTVYHRRDANYGLIEFE